MNNLTNGSTATAEADQEKYLFENFGLTKKVACNFCKIMCDSITALESHIKIRCSNKRSAKVHDNSFPNGQSIRNGNKYPTKQKPSKVTTKRRKLRYVKKCKTKKLRQVEKPKAGLSSIDAPEGKKIETEEEEKIAEFKVDGLKIIGNLDNLRDESGKEFKISIYRNVSNGKLQCHLFTGSTENGIESVSKLNAQAASSDQHCKNNRRPLLKCKDCPFSSKNKLSFRRHELMQHVSEKPFKCGTCNYKTTSNGGLKRHVKIHIRMKNSTMN